MVATNAFPPFRTSPQTACRPACFPPLLAPNKHREIGGGRATRQPGQVRKEAALTRSGSGRSSVSYLFSSDSRKERLAPVCSMTFPLFRKPASRDIKCGSIDDRRWRARNALKCSGRWSSGRFRARRPAGGRQALSGAGAEIPAVQFRGPDRPGRRGPYRFERVRNRENSAGLDSDRGARGRENHHGPDSGPRAQLRTAGRISEAADHPHASAGCALPGDHGKPAHGRAGDGRGLPYRRRRRAPDQRQRALCAGQRALQGLHHRRSPHALDRGVQRVPENIGRAAGARQIRVRHHRNPQGAGDGAVALPAL